jgi:chemotaxis protein methyltransferase CheR
VIEKAKQGIYTQFEVQRGLPIQMLIKHFQQAPDNQWMIKDSLKAHIKFMTHNLLEDCSRHGKFDIIYCRNVLIYFDEPTKAAVLNRLGGALLVPGFLTLGSAETVMGLTDRFKPHPEDRGIYQLA